MGKVYISDMDFFNNLELYESIDIRIGTSEDNIIYEEYDIKFNNRLEYDISFYIDELVKNLLPDNQSYYCAIRINTISYSTPWYILKEDKQSITWYYKQNNKYDYKQGKYPVLMEIKDIDNNLIISESFSKTDRYINTNKLDPIIDLDFKNPYDILNFETEYNKENETLYIDGLYGFNNSRLYQEVKLNKQTNIWYSTKLTYKTSIKYNFVDLLIDISELSNNEYIIKLSNGIIKINKKEILVTVNGNETIISIDRNIFTIGFEIRPSQTNVYINYKLKSVVLTPLNFNELTIYIDNVYKKESKVYIDWIRYYNK